MNQFHEPFYEMHFDKQSRLYQPWDVKDRQVFTEGAPYKSIVGGISWPRLGIPAYVAVFGQTSGANINATYPAYLLAEAETEVHPRLFEEIIAMAVFYKCDHFYTYKSEGELEVNPFVDEFCQWQNDEKINTSPGLFDAPFRDKPEFGLFLIREWTGKGNLIIPEGSIMAGQIQNIDVEDFDEKGLTNYPALEVLRFALAAIRRGFGGPGMSIEEIRDLERRCGPPWMRGE